MATTINNRYLEMHEEDLRAGEAVAASKGRNLASNLAWLGCAYKGLFPYGAAVGERFPAGAAGYNHTGVSTDDTPRATGAFLHVAENLPRPIYRSNAGLDGPVAISTKHYEDGWRDVNGWAFGPSWGGHSELSGALDSIARWPVWSHVYRCKIRLYTAARVQTSGVQLRLRLRLTRTESETLDDEFIAGAGDGEELLVTGSGATSYAIYEPVLDLYTDPERRRIWREWAKRDDPLYLALQAHISASGTGYIMDSAYDAGLGVLFHTLPGLAFTSF
ncbi:MAG: hypothetical protein C4523_09490 [Myxococcales bacterium]|nr:MAG: hypothetical protein C4523_09490 [Myxococcales bacterium]